MKEKRNETYSDGAKYVGEFKKGARHGQGTYIFPDGTKYVGEFKDGWKHGQGTMTHSDGAKYVGEFKKGARHGQGTYIFPDGTKYVGEFKDDMDKARISFLMELNMSVSLRIICQMGKGLGTILMV